jgi:hypothetical protein
VDNVSAVVSIEISTVVRAFVEIDHGAQTPDFCVVDLFEVEAEEIDASSSSSRLDVSTEDMEC